MARTKVTNEQPSIGERAKALAETVAAKIAAEDEVGVYPNDEYGPRVRDAADSILHGWMPDALATIAYEGGQDMVLRTLNGEDTTEEFYFEAYGSWLIGVYRR